MKAGSLLFAAGMALTLIFVPVARAGTIESQSGTIVVAGFSATEIVVAADSRTFFQVSRRIDNTKCKILQLGDGWLFAATGSTGFTEPSQQTWTVADVAIKIASEKASSTRELADKWGAAVAGRLNSETNSALKDLLEKQYKGGGVSVGLFLGIEQGRLAAILTQIFYDSAQIVRWSSNAIILPNGHMHFAAIGETSVFNELQEGKSAFAKTENMHWSAEVVKIPVRDRDVRHAVRFVELTIDRNPNKNVVGGPIDAAELTPSGVRWYRRKSNCGK